MKCIECGDRLLDERAQLGYEYCTKESCQARRFRGVTVTAIGANKSGDSFVVADEDELRARAEAGEFTRKDTGIGIRYRDTGARTGTARGRATPRPAARGTAPSAKPWTSQQESIVRLYHDMGLSPAQIVERARQNVPRLGVTAGLVVKILSANRGC